MVFFRHSYRSIIAIITTLVLIAAAFMLITASRNEPLRYDGVNDVSIAIEYPPFTVYHLSSTEINTLLDELSSVNFAEREAAPYTVEDGDGVTCAITTDVGSHTIYFLRPYCFVDGSKYILNDNVSVFQTVDQFVQIIRESNGSNSDPQDLLTDLDVKIH